MRKTRILLFSSIVVCVVGCTGPPSRIQTAISIMNRHMPEYVREANKALADKPDAERLIGMGMRLRIAMDSLDRWAKGEGKK